MQQQRQAANLERSARRIQYAKRGAKVSQIIDNVTVTVKIEVCAGDQIDVTKIKTEIKKIFASYRDDSSEQVYEKSDKLFLSLADMYNDNKVSVEVIDTDGCGLTSSYYNSIPQQLIKI